jgi:hypothetical protein
MSKTHSCVCRSCGTPELHTILNLGKTPLANALLHEEQLAEPERIYPLELVFCPACALVQITETVPPEQLFREYFYLSSFSDTLLRHAEGIAGQVIASRNLNTNSLVIEIASNDGYLLQYYKRAGIPVLGIEPATNIASIAEERGVPTLCEFFGAGLAEKLSADGRLADVIHANNVLAHVPDLNGVARGLSLLLKKNGVAVIEVPYVKDMIDRCEFDTIYHEHLCYFSLTSLVHLFGRHGLVISDVQRLDLHGGSLRVFVARNNKGSATDRRFESCGQSTKPDASTDSVHSLLCEEERWGLGDLNYYLGFGTKVERLRGELLSVLQALKSEGKRIAVYGASAKGSTLLNYFGIGKELVEFVVDRSTVKQNHYTPGTHLGIFAPEKLLAEMPDYVLLLTWNFADEILEQQSEYLMRGGRFIIPVPEVRVVDRSDRLT